MFTVEEGPRKGLVEVVTEESDEIKGSVVRSLGLYTTQRKIEVSDLTFEVLCPYVRQTKCRHRGLRCVTGRSPP